MMGPPARPQRLLTCMRHSFFLWQHLVWLNDHVTIQEAWVYDLIGAILWISSVNSACLGVACVKNIFVPILFAVTEKLYHNVF